MIETTSVSDLPVTEPAGTTAALPVLGLARAAGARSSALRSVSTGALRGDNGSE